MSKTRSNQQSAKTRAGQVELPRKASQLRPKFRNDDEELEEIKQPRKEKRSK